MLPWVEMISTIRFDLEEGPVLDFSFPKANFNEEFVKKLAYPAFPDSYTLLSEDEMFYVFTIKQGDLDFSQHIYTRPELAEENEEPETENSELQEHETEQISEEMKKAIQKRVMREYNEKKRKKYVQSKILKIEFKFGV